MAVSAGANVVIKLDITGDKRADRDRDPPGAADEVA